MLLKYPDQTVELLTAAYTSALKIYLAGFSEDALRQAYDIGREALGANLGILDMTEIHRQALKAALQNCPTNRMDQDIRNAITFFEESLSPFEITHRGYRDAVEIVRRVANFSFMASHEIKTPLTSIHSSASMLAEFLRADPDSMENRLLANILNGATILESRADDIMDIVGLYTGALTVQTRPVNVADFLLQIFERLDPEVRLHGMRLTLCNAADLPEVPFDPQRIEQAITNLVQNAIKYASDGGDIELSTTIRDNELLIIIKDWGRGLPSYEQNMLLFGEGANGRDDHAQGTGLGLVLCQKIVEAHGGKIRLINRKPKGSTFEVQLPLAGPIDLWSS